MKAFTMKQILFFILCSWLVNASAQAPVLRITTGKTASLIFPFPVRHVDRGNGAVLVQRISEAEHILLVKAASAHFEETNLSVITGDGQLYTFRVLYDKEPLQWVYEISAPATKSIASQAAHILDNPPTRRGICTRSWDMATRVLGIYSKEDVLYVHLQISNNGPIDYEIDYLRFYLRDRRKMQRTAVQEIEQSPHHVAGQTSRVKAGRKALLVIALEKFTIPDAQSFVIDIGEKKGGRHLQLKMSNHQIIRAIPLL